jgi:hypothetical protein
MKTINPIIKRYIQLDKENEKKRKALENKITKAEKRLEMLNKELNELGYIYWTDELLKPIAKEMIKHFPNRTYDILGPFGLDANTSIHFYKKGVAEKNMFKGKNCLSITFTPVDLSKGELKVKDYSKNTKQYAIGTIGEVNGFNYPAIPIKKNIDWLISKVR